MSTFLFSIDLDTSELLENIFIHTVDPWFVTIALKDNTVASPSPDSGVINYEAKPQVMASTKT